MAVRHEDQSVTLTDQEFRNLAAFLELSPNGLFDLLTAKEDGVTREEWIASVMNRITLFNFEPGPKDSAN